MLTTPFIEPELELAEAEQDWEQNDSFSYLEEPEETLTENEITDTDAGKLSIKNIIEILFTASSNGVTLSMDLAIATKEGERLGRSIYNKLMLIVNDQSQRTLLLNYAQSFSKAPATSHAIIANIINYVFDFKKRIVTNTIAEYNTWLSTKTNGIWAIKEYDAGALVHLRKYWNAIPDPPATVDLHAPWSAAFISYILKQSDARSLFDYSDLHLDYIRQARRNRDARAQNPFRLYRISEIIARMQPGDMLCKARKDSGRDFDNVLNSKDKTGKLLGKECHVDIITEIDRANNFIRVVGGNVSDNVDHKGLTIVNGNKIVNSDGDSYFAGIGIGIA